MNGSTERGFLITTSFGSCHMQTTCLVKRMRTNRRAEALDLEALGVPQGPMNAMMSWGPLPPVIPVMFTKVGTQHVSGAGRLISHASTCWRRARPVPWQSFDSVAPKDPLGSLHCSRARGCVPLHSEQRACGHAYSRALPCSVHLVR